MLSTGDQIGFEVGRYAAYLPSALTEIIGQYNPPGWNQIQWVLGPSIESPHRIDEYDVKHSVNSDGVAVTECWLECEDDAVSSVVHFAVCLPDREVFRIHLTKDQTSMLSFPANTWGFDALVDGRVIIATIWRPLETTLTLRHMYRRQGTDADLLKGELVFEQVVGRIPIRSLGLSERENTTSAQALVTVTPEVLSSLGVITLKLIPISIDGRSKMESRPASEPVGTILETAKK